MDREKKSYLDKNLDLDDLTQGKIFEFEKNDASRGDSHWGKYSQ